ncbi:MAG: RluA family pseudouridine synthase [Pleomorphochaeta sp.]
MANKEVSYELIVEDVESKVRVDSYIASHIENISRSLVSDKSTEIYIDNKKVKNSAKVKNGQKILLKYSEEFFEGIEGEKLDFRVIYEDKDIFVINKKQGIVVHPGAGNYHNTVVNGLVDRYGDNFASSFEEIEEEESEFIDESANLRPGIVHRLDKDTSGTMVIALNRESQRDLSEQFKDRKTSKIYIALVKGYFDKRRGRITDNLIRDPKDRKKFITCEKDRGKTADTSYLVLKQYRGYALVRINIHTGRTHQIRVHLKSINHPILGDPIYSNTDKKFRDSSLMLHALQLDIKHPKTGEKMRFRAAMPNRFKDIIKTLDPFVLEKGQEKKYYETAVKLKKKN